MGIRIGKVRIRTRRRKMVAKGSHGPIIKIGGLSLLAETNSDGLWNIASYHHPHSITWRWVLSLSVGRRSRDDTGRWRGGWFRHHSYRRPPDGFLSEASAYFGKVGFSLQRQNDMRRAAPAEGEA